MKARVGFGGTIQTRSHEATGIAVRDRNLYVWRGSDACAVYAAGKWAYAELVEDDEVTRPSGMG